MPNVLFNRAIELIDQNGFCRLNSLVDYLEPNNEPTQLTFELAGAYEDYIAKFEEMRLQEKEEKVNETTLVNVTVFAYSLAYFYERIEEKERANKFAEYGDKFIVRVKTPHFQVACRFYGFLSASKAQREVIFATLGSHAALNAQDHKLIATQVCLLLNDHLNQHLNPALYGAFLGLLLSIHASSKIFSPPIVALFSDSADINLLYCNKFYDTIKNPDASHFQFLIAMLFVYLDAMEECEEDYELVDYENKIKSLLKHLGFIELSADFPGRSGEENIAIISRIVEFAAEEVIYSDPWNKINVLFLFYNAYFGDDEKYKIEYAHRIKDLLVDQMKKFEQLGPVEKTIFLRLLFNMLDFCYRNEDLYFVKLLDKQLNAFKNNPQHELFLVWIKNSIQKSIMFRNKKALAHVFKTVTASLQTVKKSERENLKEKVLFALVAGIPILDKVDEHKKKQRAEVLELFYRKLLRLANPSNLEFSALANLALCYSFLVDDKNDDDLPINHALAAAKFSGTNRYLVSICQKILNTLKGPVSQSKTPLKEILLKLMQPAKFNDENSMGAVKSQLALAGHYLQTHDYEQASIVRKKIKSIPRESMFVFEDLVLSTIIGFNAYVVQIRESNAEIKLEEKQLSTFGDQIGEICRKLEKYYKHYVSFSEKIINNKHFSLLLNDFLALIRLFVKYSINEDFKQIFLHIGHQLIKIFEYYKMQKEVDCLRHQCDRLTVGLFAILPKATKIDPDNRLVAEIVRQACQGNGEQKETFADLFKIKIL